MSTKRNLSTVVSFSPEFVRRGANGLELVQRTGSHETITPVRATGRSENGGKRLVVGYEPRAILVNINGDFAKVVEV